MTTISELLNWAMKELSQRENARLEAQILLGFTLQCERSFFYAHSEEEVNADQQSIFEALVQRRKSHEPIAYLIGQREFWSLPFTVTTDTLIPRHETELLVQVVLDLLPPTLQKILDLGTGCGAIACALSHERPHWQVIGSDISAKALKVAQENAQALNLKNVSFLQSNWLAELKNRQFDAIIGNPPYIRENDIHLIHGDLPFEPVIALTPGPTGLEAFEIILSQAKSCLKPRGWVAIEHGFDQGEALRKLMLEKGYSEIQTYIDPAGNERVTVGRVD